MTPFAEQLAHRDPAMTAADAAKMHSEIADVLTKYSRSQDARMHRRLAATFEAASRMPERGP